MIDTREKVQGHCMSHIIADLFVKQTNENGNGIVTDNTPKRKIGKEGRYKIEDGGTKRTFILAYRMTQSNNSS